MRSSKIWFACIVLLMCWGSLSLCGLRSFVSKLKVRWGLSSPALPRPLEGIEGFDFVTFDFHTLGSARQEEHKLIKRSKMKRAKKMDQFRLGTLDPKSPVSWLPTAMITEIYAHLKKMDENDLEARIDDLRRNYIAPNTARIFWHESHIE